ncbi:glycosyltransferase [Methylomonas sp. MgM2]
MMNDSTSKHIVFFAEAVTLAHLARCVALANALFEQGYRVTLAADCPYDSLIGQLCFSKISLHSITPQIFSDRLAKALPLYTSADLVSYVDEDLKLFEMLKPDFVIGDFRLSLAISCRLANIPYASVTNAYWSPYADIDYPVPDLALTRIVGVRLAQRLFDLFRPAVFKFHTLAFNRACRKFGLMPLVCDLRELYTHADYTWYADLEGLVPMKAMPENHGFIGPVLWSVDVPLPEWWCNLPDDEPIVFVTLGSSGDSRLLPMILEVLASMPVTTVCVTAKKTIIKGVYSNIFVTEFLSAEAAVKKADIVICNGGSPMVYQSLAENKAIIGIPSNLDQHLMMSALVKAGKGIMVRAGQADSRSIRAAMNQALVVSKKLTPTCDIEDLSLKLDTVTSIIDRACGRRLR